VSDETYKQDIEAGRFGDARGVSNAFNLVKAANTLVYKFRKVVLSTGVLLADAMASTTTAESFGFQIPILDGYSAGTEFGIVRRITLTPDSAITGDAANAATVTVSKRDSAGGSLTTLGTITTLNSGAGSFTAFVGEDFTLTSANLILVAGGTVTWSIAKNGTGVVMPNFEIAVHVQRL
jgi:hypothetical protein